MLLFTVGPVQMYPETLAIGARQEPYFRTPEFSETMLQIERDFLSTIHAPAGTSFAALTTSGTGAMDAAISSCFTKDDRLLIVNGGSFGHRFMEICEVYGVPYEALTLPFGTGLAPEMLQPYENSGFTALAVNLSETSTGQLYDGQLLGDFCRRNRMYFVADAVSAYLADRIDMERMGIDLLLTASQKALALAPGLSLVAADSRITEERILRNPRASYYLDLKEHFLNQKRGQPPFTSAVGTVLMLRERLCGICREGVEKVTAEHHARAVYFRAYARKLGLAVPVYPLSNSCTPILFPQGGAKVLYERLVREHEIYLTPSGGALADQLLRVGHLGNLTAADYDTLYRCMKEVL